MQVKTAPRRFLLVHGFLRSDKLCLLEGSESAVLLNGLEALHRDIHNDGLIELGYVNTPFLEVCLSADLAGRVELGRTDAVRVPPANLRALTGDFAGACHSQSMVPLSL